MCRVSGRAMLPQHPRPAIGMAQGGTHLLLYLIIYLSLTEVTPEGISCAVYENASFSVGEPMSRFGDVKEPDRIHCGTSNCCMGIWTISNGTLQPLLLGCFPRHAVCGSDLCTPRFRNGFYKCICSSDMCNANITITHLTTPLIEAAGNAECCRSEEHGLSTNSTHVVIIVGIFLVLALSICGIMVVRRKGNTHLLSEEKFLLEHQGGSPLKENGPPTLPVKDLNLLQALREEGLASHLWLGVLNGQDVFIKSFPPSQQNLYAQEWRILNLLKPFKHENIVCLLDAGAAMGPLEHHRLLVLQHYPQGSLRNFLTYRTTDWATACHMAISLARGLAFLHDSIWQEGNYKPAVAHRDLSSENILVTSDLSCIISDFGLSVVLPDQKRKKSHDPAILNMTGTLRYMSPEILDGSLNLMSWQVALTQADVYSLGLILWEIFSRCCDLYADHRAPAFSVVYLEELGQNPTLDQLQCLVLRNKRRPRFQNMNVNRQLYDTLWETLEDCWDPDPEARISAQRTEHRLRNLLLPPQSLTSEDSGSN